MPENFDLAFMAGQIPAGMTVGVELEVVGVSRYTVEEHLGDRGRVTSYNHDVPQDGVYHVLSDASLHIDGCRRYDHNCCYDSSAEVVSPVLQGLDGFRSLLEVTDSLSAAEAKVNESCGMHIHVGAADFRDDFNRMWRIMDRYVGLGLHLKAGRDGGEYASPVLPDEIYRYLKDFAYKRDTVPRFHRDNIRRRAVNFCSLYKRDEASRTVEFRQHAGTTSIQAIMVWVVAVTNLIHEVRTWTGCAKCNSNDHSGVVYCTDCREFYCGNDNHMDYCEWCEKLCCSTNHLQTFCNDCNSHYCNDDGTRHRQYCYECNNSYCGESCPNKEVCGVCGTHTCSGHFKGTCSDCGNAVCASTISKHGKKCSCGEIRCSPRCHNCHCSTCGQNGHHHTHSCLTCKGQICDYNSNGQHNRNCALCGVQFCGNLSDHDCPMVRRCEACDHLDRGGDHETNFCTTCREPMCNRLWHTPHSTLCEVCGNRYCGYFSDHTCTI